MAEFWLALIMGLAIGGAAGWVLRGRQPKPQDTAHNLLEDRLDLAQPKAPDENVWQALEHEIEALRILLEEREQERDDDALDRLEEAVKRANGRLKVLDQSLQRVQEP